MIWFIERVKKAISVFLKLFMNPGLMTYYPEEQRKSKLQIIFENLLWCLQYHEINHDYYVYGFDRKSFNNDKSYLPEGLHRKIRDRANKYLFTNNGLDYKCILADKFIFGQLVASIGFPTPAIIGLCNSEEIYWLNSQKRTSWNELKQYEGFRAFIKDINGRTGKNAFLLEVQNGSIYLNNLATCIEDIQKTIVGKYIIQEIVIQHELLSKIYPHSVNTLRLVTINNQNNIILASATYRFGTRGSNTDNWSLSGVAIGVDTINGELKKNGAFYYNQNKRIVAHPDTAFLFKGFKIPYFSESVMIVCELHKFFYGLHSIGWDIAITNTGPNILEGNESWGISLQQFHDNNIKKVFLDSLEEKNYSERYLRNYIEK